MIQAIIIAVLVVFYIADRISYAKLYAYKEYVESEAYFLDTSFSSMVYFMTQELGKEKTKEIIKNSMKLSANKLGCELVSDIDEKTEIFYQGIEESW